jgi:nucleotide-binding universal stress UspA family protein
MEEEARLRAEARVVSASGAIVEESGVRPSITVRQGTPVRALTDFLKEREDISALVLAAARDGGPGPLVTHFAGAAVASLPCPLIIVPGKLDRAALDRLTA